MLALGDGTLHVRKGIALGGIVDRIGVDDMMALDNGERLDVRR